MFVYGEGDFKNQEDQVLLATMWNTPLDRKKLEKSFGKLFGIYQVKLNIHIPYNQLFYFYIIYMKEIHMKKHVQEWS